VIPVAITTIDMKDVLKANFHHYLKHRLHVPMLFWGPSGVGKTTAVHLAAKELTQELGKPVRAVIIKLGQADSPGDLVGMPERVSYYPCPWCLAAKEPSDEYTQQALDAHARRDHAIQTWEETQEALRQFGDQVQVRQRYALTEIWPTGGLNLVCFDEVNRASPDVRNMSFGVINERLLELAGYPLPPDSIVCATANPPSGDYVDAHELDGAMIQRFVHFNVLPKPEDWVDHMAGQPESQTDTGRKAIAFFRENPGFITPKEEKNTPIEQLQASNRGCTALVRCANFLTGHLLAEAAAGTIGGKAAESFLAHMGKAEKWVRCKDILDDYPRAQPAILAMVKDSRADMFLQTQDDLLAYLGRRKTSLNAQELANFAAFLTDLMADQVVSVLAAIIKSSEQGKATDPIRKHISAISKDPRVMALMAQHNKRVELVKAPS
jgi:DNA polymerase III delta prime subunit